MSGVNFFGIRHLSPAGGFYLEKYLEEIKPECVLIEAPCDFEDMLPDMVRNETKPPFAVLAYTKNAPLHTVLYPFAEYSPEYRAILWAHKNNVAIRFTDLPSEVFLGLYEEEKDENKAGKSFEEERADGTANEHTPSVYEKLDILSGEGSHETFWERTLEQSESADAYHEGANLFGLKIRESSEETGEDRRELLLREIHMREVIRKTAAEGFPAEKIVVVTGAYHVEGLKD